MANTAADPPIASARQLNDAPDLFNQLRQLAVRRQCQLQDLIWNSVNYSMSISPSTNAGQVIATSSDNHSFATTTALLDGARYWLNHGAESAATITTVWSSGSSHWSLRSTIGHAAKLGVEANELGGPVFRRYRKA
jgi:hypothetical protein